MKKLILGALAALFLSSAALCAQANPRLGVDGYTFVNVDHEAPEKINLKIVRYMSTKDINAAYKKKFPKDVSPDGTEVKAFSTWSADGKSCTIHMLDQTVAYQPQYVGHELIHCMYGDFHHGQNAPEKKK